MTVMMLGDSHTDIFRSMPVTRFDSKQCSMPVLTAKRFIDNDDNDLWYKLTPWFRNKKSNLLFVSLGEIDNRAHYWKHIIRQFKNNDSITEYLQNRVEQYINKLSLIADLYKFEKLILWGSPIAGEKASWSSEYPFVGSSKTRNILTHLYNVKLLEKISQDKRFVFCTAFYNFLNNDYTSSSSAPSHDGVHWHDSCGPVFWNKIIEPAVNSGSSYMLGNLFHDLINDSFCVKENISKGLDKYHTWARSEDLKKDLQTENVTVNDTDFSYVLTDNRDYLSDEYVEIGLDKV